MEPKIAAAFVKAQKAFGPALKTNTNPHFRSKYADLSACVEAVIDALNNAGIALIQKTHPCESGVMVETILLHDSGESISSGMLHVPATKNDAQGYGSALTYARRYSLMAACGIAPEDDDGNAASKAQPKKGNGTITPTTGVWDALDEQEQKFLTDIAMNVIALITEDRVSEAVTYLHEQKLDNDEKVALWTRFDSKQRAAMKKEMDARKQPTAEDYAATA